MEYGFGCSRIKRKMQLSKLDERRERKPIIMPRFTKKEPKDGMTREQKEKHCPGR